MEHVPGQVAEGLLELEPIGLDELRVRLVVETEEEGLARGLIHQLEEPGAGCLGARRRRAQARQHLVHDRADVHGLEREVAFGDQRRQLLEDLHHTAHVPAHHGGEVPSKVRIVVALFEQLHKHVHGHERILDLIGDPRDDAREELELLGLSLLGREGLLGREVFEHDDSSERLRCVAHDRVRRDLERKVAERQLHLGAVHGATTRERLEEEIAERRGQDAQVMTDDIADRQVEDLLGAPVHGADLLVPADGDDAARHVREDLLIILLLPLDLVMQTDIAHRRAELRGEHEEDLCLAPPVRTADDSLAEGEDSDEFATGDQGNRDDRLQQPEVKGESARPVIGFAPLRFVEGEEPPFLREPLRQAGVDREADRFDDRGGKAPMGADAICRPGLVDQQEGATARTDHLAHGIQK